MTEGKAINLKRIWEWVRFGTITERVVCCIDMTPCEIEYTGRNGRPWAIGLTAALTLTIHIKGEL